MTKSQEKEFNRLIEKGERFIADICQNVMHRLYPFRFIAVFVIGGILGYFLIR